MDFQWKALWKDIARHNHSLGLREAHYEMLYDWYLYPTKLKKVFPNTSDLCWRGCGLLGDFHHIWRDCPTICPFWKEILAQFKDMLGYPLPDTPDFALLGLQDNCLKYPPKKIRPSYNMALPGSSEDCNCRSLEKEGSTGTDTMACTPMAISHNGKNE